MRSMNLYQIARIVATLIFVPLVDPSSFARAAALDPQFVVSSSQTDTAARPYLA